MSEGTQGAPDTRQVEHLGPGESPVGSRGDRQAGRRVALRLDTVPCPELPGQGAWGRSPTVRLGNCAGWKAFPRARVLARVPRPPGLGARCSPRGGRAQSEGAGKGEARQRA